ncbi:hypothetical protein SAMN05216480_10939 [Pustulibacterium marinum]|uniref:Uncharacterized protein n=1 Tax=Pustulibacterium marinum TaxID=1224947 RepID=A0A1I7HGQ3_9FLAO|nr:hypothetical protein SAMN05216480_10939 [Pustulibacterium marinum]
MKEEEISLNDFIKVISLHNTSSEIDALQFLTSLNPKKNSSHKDPI